MKAFFLMVALLVAAPLVATPPSTCGGSDDYERALCAYQRRQFDEAERGFRAIVDAGRLAPQTIRSMYFLARTLMKTGRFDDAAVLFVRIYAEDKPFYDGWNCDFLLGECRRAVGKS